MATKKSRAQMLKEERQNAQNGQITFDDIWSIHDRDAVDVAKERRDTFNHNLKSAKEKEEQKKRNKK